MLVYCFSIGKIGLPEEVISQPYFNLSARELKLFQQYPLLSEATLLAFEPLKAVASIIRAHREQEDGGGYPLQLKSEEIAVPAKILAVAVDYESLKAGLLIKSKLIARQAAEFIKANTHTCYHQAVVQVFVKSFVIYLNNENC